MAKLMNSSLKCMKFVSCSLQSRLFVNPIHMFSTTCANKDISSTYVLKQDIEWRTPKEANTNLLNFLALSDVQKRARNVEIPQFNGGCHLSVTYADRTSPSGVNKFTGICIARRNKGLGTTFILRNVIGHVPVEKMFELYSPQIKTIQVLRFERRRRAKLYYLRDKPLKYSTVDWNGAPDESNTMKQYKRRKGAPA